MKLLHVYSGNLFGGIESMLGACAQAAPSCPSLHQEFALCFDDRLAADLRQTDCSVHHLGSVRLSRPTTVGAARQALDAVLVSGHFDRVICHAPWTQAIFGTVVRGRGVPLVFWAHDVMTGRHWTERGAKFVVPDLVVCNSAFTAGTVDRLYPRTPTVVVHPPVSAAGSFARHTSSATNLPSHPAHARQQVRASLDTPLSAFVIVQASRCEPWKGHALLLDALAELADEPNWMWWLIGGAQRPKEEAFMATLRRSAERAGLVERIRWVGQRSDVGALLAAADVYCQANLEPEPFGIAFIEALAAGLPVVTVGQGGACEIVDQACGVLTPPHNPRALAAALRRLLRDQAARDHLSRQAPERARHLCEPTAQLRALHGSLQWTMPARVAA